MMWEEKIFYERKDAKAEGRAEGRAEEHTEGCNALSGTLMAILGEKGTVMESVRERIISESDFHVLSRWIEMAAKAASVEQFVNEME